MFSIFDFSQRIFSYISSRAHLPLQATPPIVPKMENLDAILKKYTSEIENHLQGATFVAVDAKGTTRQSRSIFIAKINADVEIGTTLYSKSFGSRTFSTTKNEPLQTDSVLWVASLTKLVTSIACMIAVEKGFVTLDENVREILPELKDLDQLLGFEDHEIGEVARKPILKRVTSPITLRQLLSHQSGFAYDQLNPGLQEWSKYNGRTEWTMTGSYVSDLLSIFELY